MTTRLPYRSKIRMQLAASGHPHADPEIVRAAVKGGHDYGFAMRLAVLADKVKSVDVSSFDEQATYLRNGVERAHAAKHPRGKCAEEIAARIEGRASRWGTSEFHRAAFRGDWTAIETPHYPARSAGE